MVALATKDGGAALWSLTSGEKVASMGEAEVGFESFAFSPDATVVAGAGVDDKIIRFWKPDGTLIGKRAIDWEYARSQAMEFSPDGKTLAVSGQGRVFVYEYAAKPEKSKLVHTLDGHDKYVYVLRFTPDGSQLLSAGAESQIMIWDVASGTLVERANGNDGSYFRAAITRDGKIAATSGGMNRVHLWSADTGELRHTLEAERDHVNLVFSPDGKVLLTAGINDVNLWNVATGENMAKVTPRGIDAVAISPDSKQFASIWRRESLTLFDATGKTTVHEGLDEDAQIYALQYLDATTLMWLDEKERVMTMTTDGKSGTGSELTGASIGWHPKPALSWNGKHAIVPGMSSAEVWDLNTGSVVHEPYVRNGVGSVAFTADGNTVLVGYDIPYRTDGDGDGKENHTIVAYDLASGKPWLGLPAHGGKVIGFAVPETGTRFVSVSVDGTALVWDWSTMNP
jgi:WD40 repeat protein